MAWCLPLWFIIQSVEDGCLFFTYRGTLHSSASARHPHMWKRVSGIWFGCMAGSALHRTDVCSDCMWWITLDLCPTFRRGFRERKWCLVSDLAGLLGSAKKWSKAQCSSSVLRAGQPRRLLNSRKVAQVVLVCISFIFWPQKQVSKTIPLELVYNNVSIAEPFLFLFSESGFPYVVRLAANLLSSAISRVLGDRYVSCMTSMAEHVSFLIVLLLASTSCFCMLGFSLILDHC